MKKIIILSLLTITFAACNRTHQERKETRAEKNLMRSILDTHEKIMAADEQAVEHKTTIDSLLKSNALNNKDSATVLSKKLGEADDAMSNWMQKFDMDHKGKSHDEVMKYLTGQQKQVNTIDSQLNTLNAQAEKLLATYKKP